MVVFNDTSRREWNFEFLENILHCFATTSNCIIRGIVPSNSTSQIGVCSPSLTILIIVGRYIKEEEEVLKVRSFEFQ